MKRKADTVSTNSVDSANCDSKKRLQTGRTEQETAIGGVNHKKEKAWKPRKPKVKMDDGPNPPPGIPSGFKDMIQSMGGADWRLIIQKGLHDTDLSKAHNRLSMPSTQWLTQDFRMMFEDGGDNVCFLMIDTQMKKWESVSVRRWKMKKTMFVIAGDWHKVAAANHLKVKDVVQIWCFTFTQTGKHGLAMVKIESRDAATVSTAAASAHSHLSNNSPASSSQHGSSQSRSIYFFDFLKIESSTGVMTDNNGSGDRREGHLTEAGSTEANLSQPAADSSSAYCIDFLKTEYFRAVASDRFRHGGSSTQVPSTESALSHVTDATSSDIDLSLHL